MRGKVVIIGAGHVGSHCAYSLCHSDLLRELVLIDIDGAKAQSHAIDLADTLAFMPSPAVVRTGDYEDLRDADIAVIAAGVPRLPGQTRLDVLAASVEVAKEIAPKIKAVNYDGILISISNPCDIIADYIRRRTGLPASRVFGTGTALDSARLKRVLSEYTGVSAASINACSMGEHGDSQMIPFSCVTLHGVPFLKRYPEADCAAILERTRMIGMDIVNGKNATEFGIGCVLHDLVKAVLCDERRIIPVSAYLDGAYGQRDVHAGVPAVIGRGGIYEIPELPLLPEELAQFAASCDVIRTHIAMAVRI